MATFSNKMLQKCSKSSQPIFICKVCDYTSSKKSNLDKHLLTRKHADATIRNTLLQKSSQSSDSGPVCCGKCGKGYQTRTGLWRHKKVCESFDPSDKDVIMMLIKENADLKNLVLKVLENGTHNTTTNMNTTHTNSHNKAFNLNFFLNETCKNAMNITDFVDSIKLQLSDLIEMGEVGYVDGLSKIIVKNLNNLDETERPIHCTDKKRETMYVKDEGTWVKEDDKKTKIIKLVKNLADKNIRLLPQFREKYPDYGDSSSRTSDRYEKMVIEAMTCDDIKNEKIVKNISKAVTI